MTKDELATRLNGREYRKEMTAAEEAEAKAAGLLVIFGASDDLTELRGVLHDEAGAWEGETHRVDSKGFVPSFEQAQDDGSEEAMADYFARKGAAIEVRALWSKGDYSWVIEVDVPHAVFDIVEDDEKYCRGVVIEAAALFAKDQP